MLGHRSWPVFLIDLTRYDVYAKVRFLEKKGVLGNESVNRAISTLFRSFFLQCSWNLERMQNLGFLYALLPSLKRIYSTEKDRKAAQVRHLEFFNSQPYMASCILGAVVNMERECAEGRIDPKDISDFKSYTMTAFAAMGDSLFWNSLRPFCAVLALFFVYHERIWAPLVFLASFNTAHLFVRGRGFHLGVMEGLGIIDRIRSWQIPVRTGWLKKVLPLLLGLLLFQAVSFHKGEVAWFYQSLALPAVLCCYVMLKKNISPAAILSAVFVMAVGVAYAVGI